MIYHFNHYLSITTDSNKNVHLNMRCKNIVMHFYLSRHVHQKHRCYRSLSLAVTLIWSVQGVSLQHPEQVLLSAQKHTEAHWNWCTTLIVVIEISKEQYLFKMLFYLHYKCLHCNFSSNTLTCWIEILIS